MLKSSKKTHTHTHTYRGTCNHVTALEAYKNRTYPTTSWGITHSVLFLYHWMAGKWQQFNMNIILFWNDSLSSKFIKEVAFWSADGEHGFGRFCWLYNYKKNIHQSHIVLGEEQALNHYREYVKQHFMITFISKWLICSQTHICKLVLHC